MKIPRIGPIVLVSCNERDRDGVIWHWQLNPSPCIAGESVRMLGRQTPRQPQQRLWDEHFFDTADLLDALGKGDQKELERLIYKLNDSDRAANRQKIDPMASTQLIDESGLIDEAVKNPASYAAANLMSGLSITVSGTTRGSVMTLPGAAFVVWWRDRDQCLDVGIFCSNPRAAAYTQLLAYGVDPFPVARCKECGKRIFRDKWHPQDYCSHRCRNTHNVRNSRANKRTRRRRRKNR